MAAGTRPKSLRGWRGIVLAVVLLCLVAGACVVLCTPIGGFYLKPRDSRLVGEWQPPTYDRHFESITWQANGEGRMTYQVDGKESGESFQWWTWNGVVYQLEETSYGTVDLGCCPYSFRQGVLFLGAGEGKGRELRRVK